MVFLSLERIRLEAKQVKVLVSMDDILHELLPLGLRQAPSQGLERGTHLDFLVRVGEETFDFLVIKWSQILLYRHELLLRVR